MYDLNNIRSYLKTNIIGQTIIQYDNLNSTYEKAKNIFGTCPDGAVVLSENQSKCILRLGKEWVCLPDKNIYFSIILKSVNNNYLLPLIDVIGCSSVLESVSKLYGLNCKIKWPNDILINGKKVSSVKSEIASKGAGIILSVNINVNMDEQFEDFKITSVKNEIGEAVEREHLIGEILNNLEYHYLELVNTVGAEKAVNIYNDNLLFKNNEIAIIKRGRKTIRKVVAKKIDNEGLLMVINDKDIEEILNPGDTIIQL